MKSYFFVLCTILFIVFSGCQSANVALRSGNYDKALAKSVKKLRKRPNKEKYILILEDALAKANAKDLDRINYLKKEGTPDMWVEVFERYSSIKIRQEQIKPLLPLKIESESRDAVFKFVNYDREVIIAKRKAAEYLYTHAKQLLGNRNDRMAARQAYDELIKVKEYFANFKDVNNLINKALDQGTNKVLFKMVNDTRIPLPPDFERELTKISLHELNREWLAFHTKRNSHVYYDYNIIVNMKLIDVGPEQVKELLYKEEKKVDDGWQYVLDENGNVQKDTAGNDIKIKKYKIISCSITETQQIKVARISGTVDFYDNRDKQMIRTFPITADAIFENFSARANGDRKALKPETKAKLKNNILHFPSDFDLLLQAGRTLQPMVKDIIWDNKTLVKY